MAFSASDIESIVWYLGFPATQESIDKVTERCTTLTALSSEAETRVKGILTDLAALEDSIDTEAATVGSAYSQLKGEGRRYASNLARVLNLKKQDDIFAQ